jgi:Ras-related protein Rab-33B
MDSNSDKPKSDEELERISKIPANISNEKLENHVIAQTKPHRRIFKIIVIGDSNVGKTCLTYRFCGGRFLQRSEATIGVDFREKTVQIDDEAIKLQIWDTAGQERFRKSMIAHYYRNVHAVLFVYDVSNMQTFQNLSFWIEEYNKNCGQDFTIPKILVGNKCDLIQDQVVNTNLAQTFADMHNMPLFETSAKDDSRQDNVEAIFMTLAFKLKSAKPFYIPSQGKKVDVQAAKSENSDNGSCYCY